MESNASEPDAIGNVGAAEFVGVAAIDMKYVELQLTTVRGQIWQNLSGVAAVKEYPSGKFRGQIIHAGFRVLVTADIDAVVDELIVGGEAEKGAMAGVDADFQQALLEPGRAPEVAPGGRQARVRHFVEKVGVAIPIEDAALDDFLRGPDERVESLQPCAESIREELGRVRPVDRIVWRL